MVAIGVHQEARYGFNGESQLALGEDHAVKTAGHGGEPAAQKLNTARNVYNANAGQCLTSRHSKEPAFNAFVVSPRHSWAERLPSPVPKNMRSPALTTAMVLTFRVRTDLIPSSRQTVLVRGCFSNDEGDGRIIPLLCCSCRADAIVDRPNKNEADSCL